MSQSLVRYRWITQSGAKKCQKVPKSANNSICSAETDAFSEKEHFLNKTGAFDFLRGLFLMSFTCSSFAPLLCFYYNDTPGRNGEFWQGHSGKTRQDSSYSANQMFPPMQDVLWKGYIVYLASWWESEVRCGSSIFIQLFDLDSVLIFVEWVQYSQVLFKTHQGCDGVWTARCHQRKHSLLQRRFFESKQRFLFAAKRPFFPTVRGRRNSSSTHPNCFGLSL